MLQMLFRLYPIICLARNSGGADCPCPVLLCFFINHEHYLRKYTINFEKALAAAQKEHELIDYPKNKNLTHAFSVFEPFLDESSEVIDMMTAYLRKF